MAPLNPLDPAVMEPVAIALSYAKLYPSMVKDFMGKQDCALVHATGNMIANTTGSPTAQSGPITHTITKGGSDKIAQGKKAGFSAAAKTGDVDSVLSMTGVTE